MDQPKRRRLNYNKCEFCRKAKKKVYAKSSGITADLHATSSVCPLNGTGRSRNVTDVSSSISNALRIGWLRYLAKSLFATIKQPIQGGNSMTCTVFYIICWKDSLLTVARSLRVTVLKRLMLYIQPAEALSKGPSQKELRTLSIYIHSEKESVSSEIEALLDNSPPPGLYALCSLYALLNTETYTVQGDSLCQPTGTVLADAIDRAQRTGDYSTAIAMQELYLIHLTQYSPMLGRGAVTAKIQKYSEILEKGTSRLKTILGHEVPLMPPLHNLLLLTRGRAFRPLVSWLPDLDGPKDMLERTLLHLALDLGVPGGVREEATGSSGEVIVKLLLEKTADQSRQEHRCDS